MSTEKLRERALDIALDLETLEEQPVFKAAQLLRDLCGEIDRLEKENGELRDEEKRLLAFEEFVAFNMDLEGWVYAPAKHLLIGPKTSSVLRGEGGKG